MMANFGKEIMSKEFVLDPVKTFTNHASFGAVPWKVVQRRLRLIEKQEEQPEMWFRREGKILWRENILAASEFVRSEPQNLVFVNNATTGANDVLHSLKFSRGDGILLHEFTFFTVRNTCRYIADRHGLELITVALPSPLSSTQQLLAAYEETLASHPNIRLVILDYISCMPPVLMPIKELIAVCRRYPVKVFVDGAQTPGQVQLDLENLGADFFVGNLHKWAFAPRGCAILWIHPDYHRVVFPAVTSFYDVTDMERNFYYLGTNDNTQFYTARAALDFYTSIGGYEKISTYCSQLVSTAADLLVTKWKTRHYPLPVEMKSPFMRMVRLPVMCKFPVPESKFGSSYMTELLMTLWDQFGIQTVCVAIHNEPWIRISASVYNCLEDYDRLADSVLLLAAENDVDRSPT